MFVNLMEEHIVGFGVLVSWCRHTAVVLLLIGPGGQCVGRAAGSQGLYRALGRLHPCPFGLSQAWIHFSHSWRGQNMGQITAFLLPRITQTVCVREGLCGRRWNCVFLDGRVFGLVIVISWHVWLSKNALNHRRAQRNVVFCWVELQGCCLVLLVNGVGAVKSKNEELLIFH